VAARSVRLTAAATPRLEQRFRALRASLEIPEAFPAEVLAEAEQCAANRWPPGDDQTATPFVTLDPPGARDLDQAFHLERRGDGFRVRYAIADVATFVRPGGAVDTEAHRRVETAYSPDGKTPLHPTVLSEGAASLLPDADRPAVLWTLDVDRSGTLVDVDVRRATVRSRAQLDYPAVQAALDSQTAPAMLALLPEVGRLLQAAEQQRGGMSLNTPTQEVVADDGTFHLQYRVPLPSEGWNAQLSLLTGRAAARLMLDAGIGVLRTMPPADPRDVRRLRGVARGLHVHWPDEMSYRELLAQVDARRSPGEAAFLHEASVLFRGAAYAAFDGHPPDLTEHAAIAAPYAHCTAPLRRLVDRYASEVCLCVAGGRPVPDWARRALPSLPAEMATGGQRAARLERANLDLVEAAVLSSHIGQEWDAVVVEHLRNGRAEIVIDEPAVIAPCDGPLPVGAVARVRLVEADLDRAVVRFKPA